MDLNNDINNKVREFLLSKNMTQRDLATDMDIVECELSQLLNNQRNWTVRFIVALSKATGIGITIGADE